METQNQTSGNEASTLSAEAYQAQIAQLKAIQAELEAQNRQLRQAEDDRLATRSRYFDLYDQAPVGYCTLSNAGFILEANHTACTLVGAVWGGLTQWPINRLILQEDLKIYTTLSQQLLKTGKPQECELQMLKMDGTPFWAHLKATAIQLPEGAPACHLVLNDISERKQAETELKESEAQNQALIRAIPDIVFLSGRDGEILSIHAPDPTLLFTPLKSSLHRKIDELLPEAEATRCLDANTAALESGMAQQIHYSLPIKGQERDFEARIAPCTVDTVLTIVRDITERKQAEETLRQFKALVEHSSDAIGMSTAEGKHYYQNEAFTHLFGEVGETPSKTLYADLAVGLEVFNTIQAGGNWQGEVKMLKADQSLLDILLRAYAIKSQDGRVIGVVGVHTDFTARKQAEMELRESERKFRLFFESVNEAIYIHDENEQILDSNPLACEQLGYSRSELLSMTASQVDAHEEAGFMKKQINQLKAEGILECESLHRCKDGSTLPVEIKAKLIQWRGQPAVISICRDLTERKKAEVELSASERKFRRLFETMKEGVFYQRADGSIIDINAAALRMFGLSRDEVLHRTSDHGEWKVVREDGSPIPPTEHPSILALSTGKLIQDVVGVWNPQTREYAWVSVSAVPEFVDGETSPYQVAVTMHDVTQNKRSASITV